MKNSNFKSLSCICLTVISALACSLGLVGCRNSDNVVRINEVTHSVFYAPMYLADALGYYEENGFKVEFTNGGGADNTMAAVLSGAADVGFCGPEAALYVNLGGSTDSPKVFGQLTTRDGSFLVSRKNEKQTFTWQDLQGKEILAGRKGGVPAMTFEYTLKNFGVKANLNYDVAFNMMTAAFEGGVADYCTMFEPTASAFEAQGKGYIVASVGKDSGAIPYTCFLAKDSYISHNESTIDGILLAVTKATKYAYEHDNEDVARLLVPYFEGTELQLLTSSIRNYKAIDAWARNMAMVEDDYERLLAVMENAGELSGRVPFDTLVKNERAENAYKNVYVRV